MDYEKSVELALAKGYQAVPDQHAYWGVFYVRSGLIWIHNIDALMRSLGVNSTEKLRDHSYDVDYYHKYKDYSNDMADVELKGLYAQINPGEGQPAYLMDGMYLFPDGSISEL